MSITPNTCNIWIERFFWNSQKQHLFLWGPRNGRITGGPLLQRISRTRFRASNSPRVKVTRIHSLWRLYLHVMLLIKCLFVHLCKSCDPMGNQLFPNLGLQPHPKPKEKRGWLLLHVTTQIKFLNS